MIYADFGIFLGRFGFRIAAQRGARPGGVAINERTHHRKGVVVRSGQPILQRQKISPDVLGGAGNKFQQLGQAAQHRHLGSATIGRAFLRGSAQLLQPAERPLGRGIHAVITHARHLDDFGCRHEVYHCIAMFAARLQRRLDGADLVFEKDHRGQYDVTAGDVGARGLQLVAAFPIGGGVKADRNARLFTFEARPGALDSARKMVVECDDDHANCGSDSFGYRRFSVHNGPWLRKASRR